MRGYVTVLEAGEFDAWMAEQVAAKLAAAPAAAPVTAPAPAAADEHAGHSG
jgi:heme/copper-type cytochrome/quinol oxidase subunit 2